MRLVHIHLDYIEINDKNKVLEKLKELSKKTISNYIIDYHFEENYYNIILDIKELLHFYNEGNVVLEPEHVSIYEQLLNIDNLDFAEAKKLHQLMKKYNMKEIFYDDMRIARQVVKDAIKNYSLSQESIRQYRDEKLSEKYGVDVYFLNGNHFFGIVKTGRYLGDMFPTGHSFSLVGTGGIAVYGNLNDSETFLYDSNSLNPEQIVHVYPYDSYTYFAPFKGLDDSTTRVNTLAMPDEIVSITSSYNEILIYEKGIQPTELDNRIPQLKKIALYCVDRITEKDIEQANKNGVGIILINSNSYIPENPRSLYSYRSRINPGKYDYFDGINDKKEYEMSRR